MRTAEIMPPAPHVHRVLDMCTRRCGPRCGVALSCDPASRKSTVCMRRMWPHPGRLRPKRLHMQSKTLIAALHSVCALQTSTHSCTSGGGGRPGHGVASTLLHSQYLGVCCGLCAVDGWACRFRRRTPAIRPACGAGRSRAPLTCCSPSRGPFMYMWSCCTADGDQECLTACASTLFFF